MLEKIAVRNFQSLRAVDLDLGRFTVIVGASSSGKTALMRALRAVASNLRGGGSITRGAKSAAITVHTSDHIVTLERTETSGLYRVITLATGTEQTYTKLAGAVPETVTRALGVDPVPTTGTSVNFAGQFDRPFLLDDSGANVARELGELTNVTTILHAVREANRRRNTYAATLKTREADLSALREQARTFTDLPTRLAACERAQAAEQAAQDIAGRIERLRKATDTLAVAEAVLTRLVLRPVPDATALLSAHNRLNTYHGLLRTISTATAATTAATTTAEQATATEIHLHTELHTTLVAAGTCPTCLRPVT